MRILVGGLFLFSGFTKSVDVWGTFFKFNEYFSVWGYEVWDSLNLVGVFLLCGAEFLVGFCILLGCFRRTAPVMAIIIMAFMLPLTLWLAAKNPIADCGCFGDALKISNWATFYKNVLLLISSVWLLFFNRRVICLITPYLQWIGVVVAGGYIIAVSWLGYFYQPLIDFRPYKTGTPLVDYDSALDDEDDDEDDGLRFVYEKDGVEKEFTIDDVLPDEDDGWTFVRRYYAEPQGEATIPVKTNLTKREKNLRLFSEDGHDDVTEETVGSGKQLILFIPKLSEVSAAKTWVINSLYDWCKANGVEMLAAVGGNPYEIAQWKDISLAEYPLYTSDDTAIEEVVRGNPGVVYLEDGIIRWKRSLRSINVDDFRDEEVSRNPMNFAVDNGRILGNLSWIFLVFEALLVILSFSPRLFSLVFRKRSNEGKRNE